MVASKYTFVISSVIVDLNSCCATFTLHIKLPFKIPRPPTQPGVGAPEGGRDPPKIGSSKGNPNFFWCFALKPIRRPLFQDPLRPGGPPLDPPGGLPKKQRSPCCTDVTLAHGTGMRMYARGEGPTSCGRFVGVAGGLGQPLRPPLSHGQAGRGRSPCGTFHSHSNVSLIKWKLWRAACHLLIVRWGEKTSSRSGSIPSPRLTCRTGFAFSSKQAIHYGHLPALRKTECARMSTHPVSTTQKNKQ